MSIGNNLLKIESLQKDHGGFLANLCGSDHSFIRLQKANGFSRSEFSQTALADGVKDTSQYFVASYKNIPKLLLFIRAIDRISGVMMVQLWVLTEINSDQVISFINALCKKQGITRITSFVFPEEILEQNLLKKIGLDKEVRFRSQIYWRGGYRDLYLYGTDRLIGNQQS